MAVVPPIPHLCPVLEQGRLLHQLLQCRRAGMGWGLLAGNHSQDSSEKSLLHLLSQLEVLTPNRINFSWHQSLLPSSSTAQPWSRKVQREIKIWKNKISVCKKPKLAFRDISLEKWLFGNPFTHFLELGAAFGVTEPIESKALHPRPPHQLLGATPKLHHLIWDGECVS